MTSPEIEVPRVSGRGYTSSPATASASENQQERGLFRDRDSKGWIPKNSGHRVSRKKWSRYFLIVNVLFHSLKGLCHEMNIFWRLIITKSTLWTCPDSFYNFLFLSWWNNQTQIFSLLLWNYLLILTILPVIRIKDTKRRLWHRKCSQEASCDYVKSYRKHPVTSSCAFSSTD